MEFLRAPKRAVTGGFLALGLLTASCSGQTSQEQLTPEDATAVNSQTEPTTPPQEPCGEAIGTYPIQTYPIIVCTTPDGVAATPITDTPNYVG